MRGDPKDVPVTVIGGFLGAGKTTLVNHLVRAIEGRRVGVLVNDFGELEIDKRTIVAAEDDVVSLANGCMCCTMRGSVMSTVYRLLERGDAPEHLVVEASGVSDPRTLAELFIEAERIGTIRLDALISVIDAERFDSGDQLARAQVVAADLAILNKVDLVDPARLESVRAAVREIAPTARTVEAVNAEVPLAVVLGGGAEAIRSGAPFEGIDASGFETWTYENDAPYSFRRLLPALADLPPAVLRAKGVVNLVEREGQEVVVQVVGRRLWVKTVGAWTPMEAKTSLVMIARANEVDADALAARLDTLSGAPGES